MGAAGSGRQGHSRALRRVGTEASEPSRPRWRVDSVFAGGLGGECGGEGATGARGVWRVDSGGRVRDWKLPGSLGVQKRLTA